MQAQHKKKIKKKSFPAECALHCVSVWCLDEKSREMPRIMSEESNIPWNEFWAAV